MNEYLMQIADALKKLAADQAEYLVWAKARDEESLQMQRKHLDMLVEHEKRWRAQEKANLGLDDE